MKFMIALLSLFSLVPGWAGGVNSGGGYVVACKEGEVTTYQLWDFKEASIKSTKFEFVSKGSEEVEIALTAIERLRKFSPDLTDRWQKTVKDFIQSEMKFINDAKIKDIDDTDSLFEKFDNCELVQAAVQVKSPAPNEYRLFVDETLWKAMDANTKAGLLVHEAIYKTAMEQGHTKSKDFRRITALLFDNRLEMMTDIELATFFNVANINGCFVKNFEYSDYYSKEMISIFKLPIEIKSLTSNGESKRFTGNLCGDGEVKNFFQQGRLEYLRGNKIEAEPLEFCIEDSKDFDLFTFHREINGQSVAKMEGKLCMNTYDKERIFYAKYSPFKVPRYWPAALEIETCEGQYFKDGQLTQCEKLTGSLVTKDGQTIELKTMVYDHRNDSENYQLLSPTQQLKIGENTLKLFGLVAIESNLDIVVMLPKVQKIKMNDKTCTIYLNNQIVLDQWGEFKGISDAKNTSSPDDSCVHVLNKN